MYLICTTESHQTFDDAIMDVARKMAYIKSTDGTQNDRLEKYKKYNTVYNQKVHCPNTAMEKSQYIQSRLKCHLCITSPCPSLHALLVANWNQIWFFDVVRIELTQQRKR